MIRIALLAAFSLFTCTTVQAKELARVGSVGIDDKPLSLWAYSQTMQKVPNQIKDLQYFGLAQEIRSELGRQIAKKYEIKIADEDIIAYSDSEERANPGSADIYKRLKEFAGNDKAFYARTLYTTQCINVVLQSQVYRTKSGKLSESRKVAALDLAKQLSKNPGGFNAKAKAGGYAVKSITASVAKGIRTDDNNEILSIPMSVGAGDAEQAGTALKKGDVSDKVIESREYFLVVKGKGGKKDGEQQMEAILVPKLSYDEWFWSEAKNIQVTIPDKKLKKEIVERALWAKKLKIK